MRAELVIPTAEIVLLTILLIAVPLAAGGFTIANVVRQNSKRFRPDFAAQIDAERQAIRLDVKNKGRASGQVRLVAVVDVDGTEHSAQFAGLPEGKFHSAWLGGRETRHLIIAADKGSGAFPSGVGVRVEWGKDGEEVLPLVPVAHLMHGLESNWPPPQSGGDAN